MATSLAQQLQRLAAPQSTLVVHKKSRASLLFDKREAALLDRDTVFSIGREGFSELVKLSPALLQYESLLFSENAKTLERAVQTQEVNDQLDGVIDNFLCHVSPLLPLRPSHKALEWLIYRFHIHEYNMDSVLRCALPHHESNIFARLLQLLPLQNVTARWQWLRPLQRPGVPLTRATLAVQCASDISLMKFICSMNRKIVKVHGGGGGSGSALHTPVAFFVSSMCAALERCSPEVSEQQMALLAPHLLRCLASPLPQLRTGGYMLTAQLCRRAALSAELTDKLFTALVKSGSAELSVECAAALAVLAQTQQPAAAPPAVLLPLLEARDSLLAAVNELAQRRSVLPLLTCLLRSCLLESARGKRKRLAALREALVSDVRLNSSAEQRALIDCVVELFVSASGDTPAGRLLSLVCPLLCSLERQYPAPFDAAAAAVSTAADKDGGRARTLINALRGRVGGAAGCGVFVELNHPEESTRYSAIKQLMRALRSGEYTDEGLLWSALTSALDDQSDRVVRLALRVSVPLMLTVADRDELTHLMTSCLDAGHGPSVAMQCAAVLAELHATAEHEDARPVSSVLLTSLLPPAGAWSQQAATHLSCAAQHLGLDDLHALLTSDTLCSHAAYTGAALQQLSSLVCGLPEEARLGTLHALSERLSKVAVPLPARMAAAAVAAEVVRQQPSAADAAALLPPLLTLMQTAQVKVMGPLSRLSPEQLLLQDMTAAPDALLCLLAAAIDATPEIDVENGGWLPNDQVAVLEDLYRSAAAGLGHPRSRLRPLCQTIISHLFQARLPSLAVQLRFLSRLWSAHETATSTVAAAAAVAALVMATALLRAAPAARLPPLLAPAAPLLPSLLPALQSPLAQVRAAALECLQLVATVKVARARAPLLPAAVHLASRREEIAADPGAVWRSLAECPGDWRHHLSALVASDAVPDHVRASLAALLTSLADQSSARACLPTLSALLSDASASSTPLSADRSAVLIHLLRLLTPETASLLAQQQGWQVLQTALTADQPVLLSQQDGTVSPQSVALGQVTRSLFSALATPTQQKLVKLLVDLCTDSTDSSVVARLRKVLRRLPLTADMLVHELGEQGTAEQKTLRQTRSTRRSTVAAAAAAVSAASAASSAALPDTPAAAAEGGCTGDGSVAHSRTWRRLSVTLELCQSRLRRLQEPAPLVGPLFAVLRRSLQLPETEYHRQLVLTCLQTVCEQLQTLPAAVAETFSVDTLVQCVRASDSTQTHQQALIVLSMAARMLPETVLHSVMAVFTFMGSSLLRQDTEYSFRVIERTIDSVVPALLKASAGGGPAVSVLRVFVDAVRDVPRHRRLPLFSHLLRTLGAGAHLWRCLVMLADRLALKGDLPEKLADDTVTVSGERSSPMLELAVNLCSQFPLADQLAACSRLLQHTEALLQLRHAEDGAAVVSADDADEVDAADTGLFDLLVHSDKQFYKHCHAAVGVIGQLLASEEFVSQSSTLSEEQAVAARSHHQRLLERTVRLISACSRLCAGELRHSQEQLRHVRAILHRLYTLLDKINALLPSSVFLSVVAGLLHSELSVVRRRAMELLSTRLQLQTAYFTEADTPALLAIADDLAATARAGGADCAPEHATPQQDASAQQDTSAQQGGEESALSRQTALFALKLLSRLLAAKHPARFAPVLRTVCDMGSSEALPAPLLASSLLCVAELCASLGAHAIVRLPAVAALLLNTLSDQQKIADDLVLVSAVTLVQKLVEALPHFVSPYLSELLTHVCVLSARRAARDPASAASPLQHRLRQARRQLAVAVAPRLLLPAAAACWSRLLSIDGSACALRQLMKLLQETVAEAELAQINAELPALQNLLITALDFRCSPPSTAASSDVRDAESDVIGVLTSLVPRLSEASFRPLFLRLYDWATRADAPPTRAVTFYRLCDALADKLRGLFVLFSGHFVKHLASVLRDTNSISETPQFPDDEANACELAEYALACLHKVCSHDTEGFLTADRFHVLMQPLIDQLENTLGDDEAGAARLRDRLLPCLVSFLVAAGDDTLWKPANYQLLLKTRHPSPQVRLAAVAALSAVHGRLGDDYLTLLPETMPFLAELLEDELPDVEAAAQALIKQTEEALGESLQKYF